MKKLFIITVILLLTSSVVFASETIYSDKSVKNLFDRNILDKPISSMNHLNSRTGFIKAFENILSTEELSKIEKLSEIKNANENKLNKEKPIISLKSFQNQTSDKSVKAIFDRSVLDKPVNSMNHLNSNTGNIKFFEYILSTLSNEELSKIENLSKTKNTSENK